MKRKVQRWLPAVIAGLALAGSCGLSQAQTAVNPQTFDTALGSWVIWNAWGLQGFPVNWDPLDAAGDPNSGSMRLDVSFVGAPNEQFMVFGTLGNRWQWDGGVLLNCVGGYTNISLDLKMDPSTAPTKNGNYGPLSIGLVTDGWKTEAQGTYTIPLSATEWTHINIPINQTTAGLDKVTGLYLNMWSNGTYTNTMSFFVDNLWIEPATNAPPPPPPTMTFERTQTGLNLIAAGTGQYDRQNIRTVTPDYTWVGKSNSPVSYAFTVKAYPGAANPDFEVHTYLVPLPFDPGTGVGTIGTDSAPDWGQLNCIFMELQNKADGSATFTFRWKTNSIPDGNGTYYSDPLAVLTEPKGALGTWTLSFVNDTNVTMTSPSGTTTNFMYSPDKLAGYVDNTGAPLPLYFYIGAKPQQNINRGLYAVISQVKVQGFAANIDDNFLSDSELNTNIWEVAANSASAIQLVTPENLYWLGWTLPDAGFTLQTNSVAAGTNWNENGAVPFTSGLTKQVLVSRRDAEGNSLYYRLIKRVFSKLQVLMPGETNAPGTVTGKIGTPTDQQVNVPFDIVVNAVDDTWHIIALAPNDMIAITSSDSAATLPQDANLAGGKRTFSVTIMNEGPFTITATDATDNTKKADTSTSTKATP